MHRLTLILALCTLLAGPLRGEQDASLEQAKAHAARAKVHYDLGEYQQAAEEYILVYRIKSLPALLYNIAQSYRQAGQYEKARQFYKSYLREMPDPKNRSVIEKAIRELDELLVKEKRAKEGPPKGVTQPGVVAGGTAATALLTPPPPPTAATAGQPAQTSPSASGSAAVPAVASAQPSPATNKGPAPAPVQAITTASVQPSRGGNRTYLYMTAGAAAVFLGGGLVFSARAKNYEQELSARAHPQATMNDLMSSANSSRTLGALLLGAGAAAAVGAGLLYFLPSGDGVAVQGRF
jgi:tetratricopeptide (TPR) repeat protein